MLNVQHGLKVQADLIEILALDPTPTSLGPGLSRVASGLSQDLLCPASVLGRRELVEAPDLGPHHVSLVWR